MKYVAYVDENKEHVTFYGEGDSPQEAVEDFITNGEFSEYCFCNNVNDFVHIKICEQLPVIPESCDDHLSYHEEGYTWVSGKTIEVQPHLCM